MAKVLLDNFIIHYRLLEKILFDQGKSFESELITNLCKLIDTMLGMLPPECKSNWKGKIGMLVHMFNCTHNSAMGFSPSFLMYIRQP